MADWNQPTITTNYLQFVTEMNEKFTAVAGMLYWVVPAGLPSGTMRFNRSPNMFEETDGTTWFPRPISIAGGGTGSGNAAGARTNLGLGSMSTQNSNAVNITGGTITGVTYSASDINTGVMALARGGTGASLALGQGGYILMSNGSTVFFDSGVNISQLNANNIILGTVTKARLPASTVFGDQNNSIGGTTQLSDTIITSYGPGPNNYAIRSVYPLVNFNATSSLPNQKNIRIIYSGGSLDFQQSDDASTVSTSVFRVDWNGNILCFGGYINGLNASNITAGRVAQQFLGMGGFDTSTFLRGDGYWAIPPTGGGGAPIPFPSGMISMFANGCPAGWTRVSHFDNRFPMGGTSYGQQGGNTRHGHSFSVNTNTDGNHSHSFSANVGGARAVGSAFGSTSNSNQAETADGGSARAVVPTSHNHDFGVNINIPVEGGNVSGDTSLNGNHYHQVTGNVTDADQYPPYTTVFFCQKD